ncbi:DUF763 domain-containing protein [Sulfuracidifex metallicus]|uniref:DUF763 domain-containing protein n=1 Tax=Sulfuracidifex metallicus DSM 6482 = JCM 9184 TaxID=523847 RepID=A0A6A9QRF4_SULME|nr:DUF763 domain-containing protein [Sulfuracidifex metallicus]MUN28393.1 DUF763 domain-containing protein [Sulfuracidifex metallicus DSM 6482 = JCM 9184]WOE51088.1 DUF763 domain-containing protein [Sulfuracidifex metallicus DSM 6482 = JCM 9184]
MEVEGIADLPLHTGHVPPYLIPIMRRLSSGIIRIMIDEWGPSKVVERLSNPLWFQGLNNVIGMDWDSSGSTTVTLGILKEVVGHEYGLAILGGKGKSSLRIPEEIDSLNFDVDKEKLKEVSKLVAKVDTTAIQDGYQLYHQSLIVSDEGKWGIIQQGMNEETKFARRYHWVNQASTTSVHDVAGLKSNSSVNVVMDEAQGARRVVLDLIRQDPRKVIREIEEAESMLKGRSNIMFWVNGGTESFVSPQAKLVYMKPIDIKKIGEVISKLNEFSPASFDEALLQGLGPSTAKALYLVADLIYREPPSYSDVANIPYDPFKYAFAVGGKDGVPYPVNRRVAYEVIRTLENMIERSKLDRKDKKIAFRRLKESIGRT